MMLKCPPANDEARMGDANKKPSLLMESATERGDSTAVAALNHSDRTKGSRHSSAAPEVNLKEW